MADCDVLVLGAGNNGLGAAALMQRDGLKTMVLEKADRLGGLCSASHFWPGFTHNTGAWAMFHSQLQTMWKILDLDSYGVQMLTPPEGAVNFGATYEEPEYRMYARLEDHEAYMKQEWGQEFLDAENALYQWFAPLMAGIGPVLNNPAISIHEMINMMPSPEAKVRMVDLFYGIAQDTIDRFYPDKEKAKAIRGYTANLCIDGLWGGPKTPGSNLALAQHIIGHAASYDEGVGYKLVKGTFGSMMDAVGKYVTDHGGVIQKNSEIEKILTEKDKAIGVKLKSGEEITCKYLFSSLDPYNTFIRLIGEDNLPGWVTLGAKSINFRCHFIQAFLVLNAPLKFKDRLEYLNEGAKGWSVRRYQNPETMEDNWDRVKMGRMVPAQDTNWAIMNPSLFDDSLAPKGKYSSTVYAPLIWPQHVPADKVDEVKEQVFQNIITGIEEYAPNIREVMEDHRVFAPPDYEKAYNTTGGSFCHGEIQLNQFFNMRPFVGMSNWQVPFLPNMYLCGSGNHPSPGVNFLAGTNAVKRFYADHKIK